MKARLLAILCLVMALSLLGGLHFRGSQSAAAPPPPGEITVNETHNGQQVQVGNKDILVIRLESNPSTGYSWQVEGMDSNVLRKLEGIGPEFESSSDLLGAPATQVLRFAGVSEGQTTLNLAYRRPWQAATTAQTFSVDVVSNGALKEHELSMAPIAVEEVLPAEDQSSILALPAAFNWCDQGKCTGVRDQGSCGSCWAFATVGPFESVIKIEDNNTRDLAEQYLVSCNSDGWSCSGGWWAHDYHEWKYISGESGAGAVYEADFPYVAYNASCNPPHTHHEKISDWQYVGGSSSVPAVASIKQALYDYGPLSVAVCVNSAFQGYSDGVFTGPSCTSVNHGVTLVGWDDNQSGGIWYIKNSWDTDWGENGYMRIKWGISRIGYAAAYVVYGTTPSPTPTPTSSSGW